MTTTLSFQHETVTVPGFGLMSLSGSYGPADDIESLAVLEKAYALGNTFWDTAVIYGNGHNEELIGKFLKKHPEARDKVFIGSKCGFDNEAEGGMAINNKPEYIAKSIEGTIERLGTIPDLYYLHRIDPNTPLEDSIAALQNLKEQGKTKYIGLSEPSAATLKKACSITDARMSWTDYLVAHIDALQIEYSPWYIDHERDGLLDAAKELGVTVVAFGPLGKGMLTGKYRSAQAFPSTDPRAKIPRFSAENMPGNMKLIEEFEKLAEAKGCSPGQLSIAWVIKQGAIPIPGTRREARMEENFSAGKVTITDEEMQVLRNIIVEAEPKGDRYAEWMMNTVGK